MADASHNLSNFVTAGRELQQHWRPTMLGSMGSNAQLAHSFPSRVNVNLNGAHANASVYSLT
jgi:hypothetical protein